jgi:hypothetical protein
VFDNNEKRCNEEINASSVLSLTVVAWYGLCGLANAWIMTGTLRRRSFALHVLEERRFDLELLSADVSMFIVVCFILVCVVRRGVNEQVWSVRSLDTVEFCFGNDVDNRFNGLERDSEDNVADEIVPSEGSIENKRRKNEPNLAMTMCSFAFDVVQ